MEEELPALEDWGGGAGGGGGGNEQQETCQETINNCG